MKIRNPLLIKTVGVVGAWAIRRWIATLRYEYRPIGPNVDPHRPDLDRRYIYAFWHETMLLPAYQYGRSDIWVLISQHADGQMIADVSRRLGFQLVRGSTTRGGAEAVRQMLRLGRGGHLAITPDGPRGPRRRVQPGLVYLAARTGMPIIPIGIGFDRPWRMGSWDRFALPRPFSRAVCVTTEPIIVPPDVEKDALEVYRERVERTLLDATTMAEQWAVGSGQWAGTKGQENLDERAA
jgi:lysophospholipid acyltransferase (LPLAT)-like uncharacterized protein